MSSLSTILASLNKGFLKNMLEGAGITLGVAGITLFSLNQAITHFKSSLGSLSVAVLQLANMMGLDTAFSIVLGAIVARYTQKSTQLVFKRR
ncbi:DUF2523 domain-containing protein [Acinetobacter haemolyticus]|uniref:DUF2523 domain-containing protein n=1 Tax=Acinetobacter haemolyticus TaxID=29430 RepID=A0AAW4J238_ACIHA|nr:MULTISPECIES: DUF2523 family protein [Acinetobacter]MBN6532969.1 DUF2523 domain-containing protein [Acinetobacter pittii]MBO3656972.1 DUF2523 domain-containing protein [Acinetobacter haemolyticus]QHI29169.1 DUF2523 domain-containing protein [Acinetobacter haemolyticus]WPO66392.1 DUF2523 family protein [Acinetobacter haemolyticus]SUU22807.1 Protein of uncharacterised function (DUF2523) [Acinetobacter haemolyticus]